VLAALASSAVNNKSNISILPRIFYPSKSNNNSLSVQAGHAFDICTPNLFLPVVDMKILQFSYNHTGLIIMNNAK
jgi:hypothetical protein